MLNKINGLCYQYKLRCISRGALGAPLLLDLLAGFLRLRRGDGKPEKDQEFPVSHISQFIIMGSNHAGYSEIKFLSMGSKLGSIEHYSQEIMT